MLPEHLKQIFYSLSYEGRNKNVSREAQIMIFFVILYSTKSKLFPKYVFSLKNVEPKANLPMSILSISHFTKSY